MQASTSKDPIKRKMSSQPASSIPASHQTPTVEIAQVEELIKRLSDYKGVTEVVIANSQGVPIRTTREPEKATEQGAELTRLVAAARRFVREASPEESLQFLRVRTTAKEVIIAPNFDTEQQLTLMVCQKFAPETS